MTAHRPSPRVSVGQDCAWQVLAISFEVGDSENAEHLLSFFINRLGYDKSRNHAKTIFFSKKTEEKQQLSQIIVKSKI